MKALSWPISLTNRRYGFRLRRHAVESLLTAASLVLFATGSAVTTVAQSQSTQKPVATPAAPATTDQKSATPVAPATGTIKGRIVAGDGQPLTNANVMAQGLTATPTAKPTRVESDGRFVFEDLPPAAYLIIGSAPGYIDQSISLGDASQWPRHLIGSNVRITMIRGGVITGLVTNAKGEPVVGVPVHATLQNAPPNLTSFFSGPGVSETDDRGIYRLYGLLPGQYIVHAGGKGQFGQFTPSGFDSDAPTYYPSSTRDTAVPVSVRSGDETSGIDIKYRSMEGHSISGLVLGNVDQSSGNVAITVFLSNAGSSSILSLGLVAGTDQRRAFSFNGIADGEYDLFATYMTRQNDNARVGTRRVTVRGVDVTGVELNLAPLASITGTISLDPIKPEDTCDKRGSQLIETIPTVRRDEPRKSGSQSMIALLSGGLGLLSEKGEFGLRNLEAARYRLEIKLPTESWYVRTINLPGAASRAQQPSSTQASQPTAANPNPNAWQGVVTLKAGESLNGVSVMVGQDAAGLYGRAGPEGAVIREGTRVHLVPVEREQANNVLRYGETFVNSDGSFAITNIAPGRYFILARVESPTETDTPARPVALDPPTRAKVRREAEAANTIIELKPCQRVLDYSLKLSPPQ
ncbi:MAG TPA: carboxypeptidase-like regulatory domain-containing protein [Pyrinomonadaceae bacterium]|jgi:hypothetical protein